ncbi:Clavaminate synthase-like protein [Patellaria atrata CBS 101060]|uniref:Clavaminate synthase-like protein n=1 Tax=Patellaria atrata CBS 101060 TaxID=1346257 RepID=A0A9P4S924_9PEZI|nr:Clavaminate synthase-like protein [Patellaria atrata CBS 101060]
MTEFRSNDAAIAELITSYNELNFDSIDELSEEPSPLDFMRYVARNRPFVVRDGAATWTARKKWNKTYLKSAMGDSDVNVAITPFGNADSPLELDSGELVFVKPYERDEPFSSFIDYVSTQEKANQNGDRRHPDHDPDIELANVKYAQTQNDNLRNEYSALFSDVPKDIPFARIALERSPEAINFWLGNSLTTTALHKDNYENIYVQILGAKHFLLLPPTTYPCINEQPLPSYTYKSHPPPSIPPTSSLIPAVLPSPLLLIPTPDDPPSSVPFPTYDPSTPSIRPTQFSHLCKPLHVTLEAGDMLYLPALWFHRVSQSGSEEGVSVAVNYWYDMDFTGAFYTASSFIRTVGLAATETEEAVGKMGERKSQLRETAEGELEN